MDGEMFEKKRFEFVIGRRKTSNHEFHSWIDWMKMRNARRKPTPRQAKIFPFQICHWPLAIGAPDLTSAIRYAICLVSKAAGLIVVSLGKLKISDPLNRTNSQNSAPLRLRCPGHTIQNFLIQEHCQSHPSRMHAFYHFIFITIKNCM